LRKGPARLLKKDTARLGEPHNAARSFKEFDAQLAFDALDRSGEWRLRHAQPLCRAAETQRFGHGNELPKLTEVSHRYLKSINRSET
jgi:hypothetical protein